jgi:hypothetical protein
VGIACIGDIEIPRNDRTLLLHGSPAWIAWEAWDRLLAAPHCEGVKHGHFARFGQTGLQIRTKLPGKSACLLFGQIRVSRRGRWFDSAPCLTCASDMRAGRAARCELECKKAPAGFPAEADKFIPKFIEIIAPDGLGSEHYQTVIYGQSLSSLAGWFGEASAVRQGGLHGPELARAGACKDRKLAWD